MPTGALPVWVPAGDLRNFVQRGGRREAEKEQKSHTQTLHPKEEQHASPGGHLFSQVCSPNVIKIGAAHIPRNAAPVRQHCGWGGTGVRRGQQWGQMELMMKV
ncbi:hypothetical protein CgunFtcFv8_012832 [Champsocephalus gunnari]|uniref:Uncharacterized protein n=1 Tax=Champsocephalus gunnari TaxID=52237 RepID=A0AAN8DSY8_CHAGU|nr:hypothetical protein CgunFtcFv8_012832 [Champsocephalus gunnari]